VIATATKRLIVHPGLRAKAVVCGHEAAHAVLAAILGAHVVEISVRPKLQLANGRVRLGDCRIVRADETQLQRRALAVVAMAGGAQDRRAGILPRIGSDVARAAELVDGDRVLLCGLARSAARLVEEFQPGIVRVAAALVESRDGKLDAHEIRFAIGKGQRK
jgi:hypothetical protein